MKKLQQPFNVFKKHLRTKHKLIIHNDINLYEHEKDVFYFGYFFYEKEKGVYGQIDVNKKIIVYEVCEYKRTQGKGFNAFSPFNIIFEQITY